MTESVNIVLAPKQNPVRIVSVLENVYPVWVLVRILMDPNVISAVMENAVPAAEEVLPNV